MKKLRKMISVLLAVSVAVAMLVGLSISVSAKNDAVNEASKGVLQINMVYTDDDNNQEIFGYGSCFLINDDTVITCAHVVEFHDDELRDIAAWYGKSVAEFKSRISYSVTITRDVTIPAHLVNVSMDMDWAVLTLAQPLQDRSPLTLRSSSSVQLTEDVYAIGFPALIGYVEDINTYTTDDVTITNGQVNKTSYGTNMFSGKNYDFIQTSCKLTSGNSGGPLVDENGYVIGICEGGWGEYLSTDYYTSIAIDQTIVYLDAMGIEYHTADDHATVAPETETPVETEVVIETVAIPTEAPAVTTAPNATLTEPMQEKESGLNLITIVIIIVAALVVIALVVVIIVVSGKKKAPVAPAQNRTPAGVGAATMPQQPTAPYQQPAPPRAPFAQNQAAGGVGETTVLSGAGETTVLDSGVGETSVLSSAPLCKLMREKGNEMINITKPDFSIGKERSRVDYCIGDNNSVSRLHARIINKDGKFFIIDQNATNGTYVNNVRSQPRREVEIKDGDQIKLSDESFTFKTN